MGFFCFFLWLCGSPGVWRIDGLSVVTPTKVAQTPQGNSSYWKHFYSALQTEIKLSTGVQGFRIVFNAFFIGLWIQSKQEKKGLSLLITSLTLTVLEGKFFQLQIYTRLKLIKLINGNSSLKALMAWSHLCVFFFVFFFLQEKLGMLYLSRQAVISLMFVCFFLASVLGWVLSIQISLNSTLHFHFSFHIWNLLHFHLESIRVCFLYIFEFLVFFRNPKTQAAPHPSSAFLAPSKWPNTEVNTESPFIAVVLKEFTAFKSTTAGSRRNKHCVARSL